MTTSGTYNGNWVNRSNGSTNAPTSSDLRVTYSNRVKAQMVSASSGILKAAKYLRDHPIDFALSTATSMGTFMLVKAAFAFAFPALGAGIAIAMITSGTIAVGRTLRQELKNRKHRVNALYTSNIAPTAGDLASAKAINMSAIVETGLQRAVFTGLLGGITGAAIGSIASDATEAVKTDGFIDSEKPEHSHSGPSNSELNESAAHAITSTSPEYSKFLEDVAGKESSGNYKATNDWEFIGKYQFGEGTLIDTGYYSLQDSTGNKIDTLGRSNDWDGRWIGKDGINSKEDFLNSPQAQENAVREAMESRWKEIVRLNLDEYIGKTVNGVEITESGLLAGSWLKGVGSFDANGIAEGGLAKFLTTGDLAPDGNGTPIESYIEKFGGYDVPFEANNPDEIPFIDETKNSGPLIDDKGNVIHEVGALGRPFNGIQHMWPVDQDTTQYISSHFGQRWGKLHAGLDISANGTIGESVVASAEGVVVKVQDISSGYGKNIIIEHPNGTTSRYCHLSEFSNIEVGDSLKQGTEIGKIGNTGHTTGPHLHYELRDANGTPYNPKNFLPDIPHKGHTR